MLIGIIILLLLVICSCVYEAISIKIVKKRWHKNRQQLLISKLRTRAKIRRQIPTRKSVQENKPDRLADLLEEAADEIEKLIR